MASKPKQKIIDSHVHLWPAEMANLDGHTWMPPGMPIAKAQLPSHYLAATKTNDDNDSDVELQGLVFVESDVRYTTPNGDLSEWANGPLEEVTFARKIVGGEYGHDASNLITGIVPWAPMDQPTSVLKKYLDLAELRAGAATWERVKGFRFLLQAITNQERFKALAFSNDFIANLRLLGRRGFSFDIGVDQRSGGTWQLELGAEAMALAHDGVEEEDRVVFIVNHLCKPDFSDSTETFDSWCNAITSMSKIAKTYMKLSGAFSELPANQDLAKAVDIVARIKPWVSHIFKSFGPNRIMFGSDWPVCTLKGPGPDDSWAVWRNVVAMILDDNEQGLTQTNTDSIWYNVAKEAYRLG